MKLGAAIVGVSLAVGAAFIARGVGTFDLGGEGSGAESDDTDGEPPTVIEQAANVATNALTGNPATLSANGLVMLGHSEGFSAMAYPDYKGQSIGFGHLIKSGEEFLLGAVITEAQAAELEAGDVAWAERAVLSAVSAPLTQAQFDALVQLCFNIGESAFKKSTLVRILNAGDYAGAAAQFDRWNKAGGQVSDALVGRRAKEKLLFTSGVYV